MKSKFLAVLFFIFVLSVQMIHAQDDENGYSTETIGGIDLNTNAGLIGGVMFRHTKEIKPGRYMNFGAEWVQVKHPNEVRIPNSSTGSVFVLGKTNYLFPLRANAGYEFVLFTKGKEDGVQVDALINGGPTLGFVKPYYILYDDGTSVSVVPYTAKNYDPATSNGAGIVGPGGFFHGFDHLKVVPGFHVKTGLSFELGAFNSGVTGIEIGTLLEAYTKTIQILDISSTYPTHNRWFYSSLYLNIYVGGRH